MVGETDLCLGTAKSALDVLAGVASEYLLNVGRTIKLLSDKFAIQDDA
jgi:transcriptional activator SPT7